MPEETSESFRVPDRGMTALLFPLGGGKVRAYFAYPTAWGNQLSGAKDIQRFSELSVETGAPAEYYNDAVPASPLASFSAASIWVESPFKDNVVLIGDAAGATDPTWDRACPSRCVTFGYFATICLNARTGMKRDKPTPKSMTSTST